MSDETTITIPIEEYRHLAEREELLNYLFACGVDNWGGYDDAMEMYKDMRVGDDE